MLLLELDSRMKLASESVAGDALEEDCIAWSSYAQVLIENCCHVHSSCFVPAEYPICTAMG